ncbi:MAG: amino acid adenylation domain-containing protein [Thermoanaerobaculia bacterium]
MPVEHADIANRQRRRSPGDTPSARMAYWRQQLGGAPEALELPTDRLLPSTAMFRGAQTTFALSIDLTESLRALSRQEGVTPFVTLLAAIKTLLFRYTGQEDIVVGSIAAGRAGAEIAKPNGLFHNTLVLRTDLSGNPTFRELLGRVKEVTLGALENEVPFERLVKELEAGRDPGRNPLFQVLFSFEPPAPDFVSCLTPTAVEASAAKFDLHLELDDRPERINGRLTYNTDLFDATTVARIAANWRTLLEGIVADPRLRIAELPLLTKAERRQVLVEWNQTEREYPRGKTVQRLFEEQAERTPEAVAVELEGKQLTYRELNARSNQLARHLRGLGVGPEVLVGLCAERSLEMVIGLLGILKAGGAYLPLDPEYPRERLRFMLEDSGAHALLTHLEAAGTSPPLPSRTILLDASWETIAREPEGNFDSGIAPQNLAYVIYTSGSTGKPKGVEIEHGPLTNHVWIAAERFGVRPGERVLQFHSLSFDASAQEIFTTLSRGGTLVLRSEEMIGTVATFLARCREWRLTILDLPTSYWHELVAVASAEHLTLPESLRFVLIGGERALPERFAQWREMAGERVRLLNAYGPTEATIAATFWEPDAGLAESISRTVPIGCPISNVRTYVLDGRLQPVPVGVPGELYIGGAGMARGYRNRPELTAERFIPDPIRGGNERIYRTGDRARLQPGGNLEYLGRVDGQVKLRGFRVELGEVEAALRGIGGVREAVVRAHEDRPGEVRLLAYLVPDGARCPSVRVLRGQLNETLPGHMVPSNFILLDALPLTPNGKLDVAALPAPESVRPELDDAYREPRTPVEEILTEIWMNLLRVDRVGVEDNFFELGGHSLLATQVISRVRDAFHVELPLRDLFLNPTVVGLASALAQRQAGRAAPAELDESLAEAAQTSRRRWGEAPVPLSFAQQRLWFLDRLDPGLPFYNLPLALRMRGSLDVEALGRALGTIQERHEVLRSVFVLVDGNPVQVVDPPRALSLSVVDLVALAPAAREAEARRLGQEESQRPFDLARGPLLRAMLLRWAEQEHVLFVTVHHAVFDGWSVEIFERELAALYEAYHEGRPSPLPALPIQYADFAVWQRERLSGKILEEQLSYWKRQLEGAPAVLELPASNLRPARQSFRGATETVSISQELADAIRLLGQREGATLFMTLLAAFKVLLLRHSGQEDIVVGSPVAGRNRSEIEGLIGFFANTLALRTDLSGDPTFRELLGRVREVAIEAYDHQDLPFEKLVEELNPERTLSHSPLFQVMVLMQNGRAAGLRLAGVSVTPLALEGASAKFDLTASFADTGKEIAASLQYNTDLFDAFAVRRMLGHLEVLLGGIAEDPDLRLSQLPLLTTQERHQVLVEWNQTEAELPKDKTVHGLFEEQAERTPEAEAVVFGAERLTYGQLNERANRLGRFLSKRGVGPEVLVGLSVERSLDMVVGLLGILKAGGAYVPVDPRYPRQRVALMLEDTAARVVLTQESLAESLPEGRFEKVRLDGDWAEISRESGENPRGRATARNLAYVIYTSGSTGTPKGVAIEHYSAVALLEWAKEFFSRRELAGVLASASICFDLSVFELFAPLASGGKVVLAQNVLELSRLPAAEEVRLVTTVPSAMTELLRMGALPASVETVTLAGEPLAASLVGEILGSGTVRRVLDLYGPTEDTVFSTGATRTADGPATIGRPLSNERVYILDARLQPLPVGVPGDLYVAGAGVARGYLNRAELTAEKFLSDPYRCGERMYRTGDRARFLPGGDIQFLGRLDHQVKIRGYRVEIGEIEAALARHLEVRACAVAARQEASGDKRLVGYVVARDGAHPTVARLRDFLKMTLPDYMVPSVFIFLEALPLTPNGKVDRRALPNPEPTRPELEGSWVAPRTPIEERLVGIWSLALGVDGIGVEDDFFALGGHSLIATQIISRARNAFQVDLPLRDLFSNPTVARLALVIAQRQADSAATAAMESSTGIEVPSGDPDRESALNDLSRPIARRSPEARSIPKSRLEDGRLSAEGGPIPLRQVEGALPLSFAQQHLWILDRLNSGVPLYNIPRALRIRGSLDVEALGRALDTIQERHEVLRSAFPVADGNPVQVIAPPRTPSLSVVDLGAFAEMARDAELRRIVEEEASSPFDLARGSLLRTTLLRLAEQEHVLLVTVHHIVFDGWSGDIFDQELAALYEAYREGRPSPLSPLPIRYADFAIWQREWLRGSVLEEQLSYWKRQLAGAPAVLELPASRSRPPVQTHRGGTETVAIGKKVAQAIRTLGQREGATLFMTLLAALKVLLLRHSGQDDVVVGSLVAGRNRSDIEGLIGFFVNTLVLRTDLSGDPTFRELLGRVREVAIGAYGHQDLPFERLVEELNPERTLSHSPLFQVMMTLENASSAPLRLAGASVTVLPWSAETTKFDLTASFEDRGEEIGASFRYDTDLFEASTVRQMLGHFRTLLEGIASDPDCHISRLPVLTEAERLVLAGKTNRVGPSNPFLEFRKEEIEQSITERFEQQVRRYSSRIAVRTATHSWTYERLAHENDRVARAVTELAGAGPERVALLFEQDAPMIAAILGSLKAGKTYVPLDASYPAERLAYMLEDSGAAVILTNHQNLALARSLGEGRCPVASLDRLSTRSSGPNPATPIGPETLAYILYTSGSTGRPKGVMQNHRNVLHFIRAYTNGLHIGADDRLSLLASYSFDAAVMDIFGALLNGATLCLWDIKARGVAGLAEWLAREEVTILHAVPTVFRAFAGPLNGQQSFPRVRLVVLGGEEAHRGDVEFYRRHFPGDCLFVNGLGPTESTVALQYFLDRRTEIHRSTVPVGYPVDDTEILLLDPQSRATELCGEIGIRSPYVALGYWGKPEVTQAAFLPDPDGGTRRIYRTGDLGRRLPDGAIQFLGRRDSQVKIRGHRIELAEVEETLLKHPSVREAVAVSREQVPGDQRLLAYLVRGRKHTPSHVELRALLERKLPDFMIPASFIWLDAFPLTPNGKIDRRALPPPDPSRPELEDGFVAPRNAAEASIARIWCEILGLESVGIHDNFFDLGGHSLLAAQLAAKIEKQLGRQLALATIFRAPTVAGLAEMLQEKRRSKRPFPSLVAVQPKGTRPPFFCVHANTGIVYYRELALLLGPNQPFYGLQAQGLDGKRAPYETVEQMAAHYVREVREVQPEGPYHLGGYSFGGKVAFEMARQLRAQGQRTALLAFFDTANFPLTPGPTRFEFVRNRTRIHIATLKTIGAREKLSYLLGRTETLLLLMRRAFTRGYEALFRPLMRAQREVLNANRRASNSYVPGFYEGRVTIFRAEDQWRDFRNDRSLADPHLGWDELCGEGVEVHEVPGGHSSLMEETANVRALAESLAGCLRRAWEAEQASPVPSPTTLRQEPAAKKR